MTISAPRRFAAVLMTLLGIIVFGVLFYEQYDLDYLTSFRGITTASPFPQQISRDHIQKDACCHGGLEKT